MRKTKMEKESLKKGELVNIFDIIINFFMKNKSVLNV